MMLTFPPLCHGLMSPIRKPLDGTAIGLMILLCACWGMQQVAIKAASPFLHPVLQNGLRSLIAALLIVGVMRWRRQGFSFRDGRFWPGIGAGLLFSGEFLLVALGLLHTTASHMVVFLYTAPIFTALGLHLLVPGERLSFSQWSGVLLAFSGMALAFSNGFSTGVDPNTLLGDAFGVGAGMLWAGTTVLIRASVLSEAPPTQTLLYQLGVASLSLLATSAIMGYWRGADMNGIAWASLLFQGFVIAFASFLAWFWLLRRYLASRLSAFSFLTPLFGVALGVLLMNDPLDPRFVAGAVLVFAGIVLVNLRRG